MNCFIGRNLSQRLQQKAAEPQALRGAQSDEFEVPGG